ncbi:hypothetical protein [Fibrella aquatilis]|uniref:Uncharacterized protein n=1 Tax=Fibrella aquatilis TaxID=2817059 RepID=A0A939G291_9BACT|nr:hypothetical protein [Fibrella aquatilis]MBO0929750.1 hypothetical protein [Fibrella aquatilis]
MNVGIRRYTRYVDWVLLLLAVAGGCWLNERTERQFDLVTTYAPPWVYGVGLLGPLLLTIFFSWKYRLFDRGRLVGSLPVVVFLVGFLFLMDALPRCILLTNVSEATSATALQDMDVVYVNKHYARTTYIGSTIGIEHDGKVLRFESSRTNFFLLRHKRCIRAEIGQVAPSFYYIRNLQLGPGERRRARVDFWAFWLKKEGTFLVWIAAFGLVAWVVSLLFGKHLKKIRLQ